MSPIDRRSFIKTSAIAGTGLLVGCSVKPHFDIIIQNGLVYDGLGNAPVKADLGISGDKIKFIGNLSKSSAKVIIDAKNKAIAPGFIDIHTHTDEELLINPKGESKIRQGVTIEVSGNCGASPFPLSDKNSEHLHNRLKKEYNIDVKWKNLDEFFQLLESHKIGMNYMTFTGHGDLRNYVIGGNDVQPTPKQLKKMQYVLEETMEFGSVGLSTGLEYAPGSYAHTPELIALCKAVTAKNGIYATHMRNEDDTVEEAIAEAIEIAHESGVNLEISHLKACNKNNWNKIDRMLAMIHEASDNGINVHADRYPYNAWGTGLSSFLPLWSRQGSTNEILERLKDASLLPKIHTYSEGRGQRIGGWDKVVISSIKSQTNKQFEGKSILECAEATGKEPVRFITDILIEENNRVSVIGFAMSQPNLQKVLSDDLVMIGSDGTAVAPYGKLLKGKPHPRYYGTMPRVLGRFSRDNKWFKLETAIYKMTGMPAQKLGLKQRSVLKKGNFADITVFNPNTIIDNATFRDPHQFPTGMDVVIVNGQIVVQNGEHTGNLPGMVLRKG